MSVEHDHSQINGRRQRAKIALADKRLRHPVVKACLSAYLETGDETIPELSQLISVFTPPLGLNNVAD